MPLDVPHASKVDVFLQHVRPHTWIFFFAAQASEIFEPLAPPFPERQVAYGHLSNSGMVQSGKDGTVHFWIYCPTLYTVEDGKIFGRHLHFVYYDARSQTWERDVFTYPLFCDVSYSRAQKWVDRHKAVWINALPGDVDNEDATIPGSLRLPYNEEFTEEDVAFFFQRHGIQKLDRLVLYCWNAQCTAASDLKEKLDNLGFVNTFHYSGGLEEHLSRQNFSTAQEMDEDDHTYEKDLQPNMWSQSTQCLEDGDCPFNDPRCPST
jgi:hypothetical protein